MVNDDVSFLKKEPAFTNHMPCPSCNGRGKVGIVHRPCMDCRGKGVMPIMGADGRWEKRKTKGGMR